MQTQAMEQTPLQPKHPPTPIPRKILADVSNSPRHKRPKQEGCFVRNGAPQTGRNPPQLGPLEHFRDSTFPFGGAEYSPSRQGPHSPPRPGPSRDSTSSAPDPPGPVLQFNLAGLPPPMVSPPAADRKDLPFSINKILDPSFGAQARLAGQGQDQPLDLTVSGVGPQVREGCNPLFNLSGPPYPLYPYFPTISSSHPAMAAVTATVAAKAKSRKPHSNTTKGTQQRRHATQPLMSAADARQRVKVVTDYSNTSLVTQGLERLAVTKEVVAILERAEAEGRKVCLLNEGYAIRDPWWVDPAAEVETRREQQEDGSMKVSFTFKDKDLASSDRRGANRKVRREKPTSPYLCVYCSARYGDATDLTRHTRVHTLVHPFKCTIPGCPKTGKQQIIIEQHMQKEHNIAPPTHRQKSYICEFTGVRYFDGEEYLTHSCPVKHLNMERRAKDRRIIKSVPKREPSQP